MSKNLSLVYWRNNIYIKDNIPLPEQWIIDINDSMPIIAYKRFGVGGKRKTRCLPEYKGEIDYYIPSPE